jgi:hypothetical protein
MASQLAEIANEPIIPVHEWDNHDVHIEVIERHMKSQEYEDYPDEIKNEFELHRQAHLDAQMQAAFKQMFQQMNDPNADPNNPGGNPAGGGGVPNEGGTNQFSQMNSPVDTQTPPQ